MECPKCGGQIQVDAKIEKCFCMYCRTEIQMNQVRSNGNHTNIHHEFEAKLALAKHAEKLYNDGQENFDAVMKAYDAVRQVGAHHADYWLSRARFFSSAVIKELKKGNIQKSKASVLKDYALWMDTGIGHFTGIRSALEAEKKQTIGKLKVAFDERAKRQEKEAALENERKRMEQEALERKRQERHDAWLAAAPERKRKRIRNGVIVAILVMAAIIIWPIYQNQMEMRRRQAELEEQQAVAFAVLEERLATDDTWAALLAWALEEEINFEIRIADAPIDSDLWRQVDVYGWVGEFESAEAGFDEAGDVALIFNWSELTYDADWFALTHLDRNSEVAINDWLDHGGRQYLESRFDNVRIQAIDQDNVFINDTPFEKEFISWRLFPSENSIHQDEVLHVYLQYDVQRPPREEVHEMILALLDEKDQNALLHFSNGARMSTNNVSEMAAVLGIHPDFLTVEPYIMRLQIYQVDRNGDELTLRDRRNVTANDFMSWTYTSRIVVLRGRNNEEQLNIRIYQMFDIESDTSGFNRANFERIANGMTLEQVNDLLARQGRLSSANGNVSVYTWHQGLTNADVTISVTFTNDVVTGKDWSEVPR